MRSIDRTDEAGRVPAVSLDRDGTIAVLRIERPETHNAISTAVMAELEAALDRLQDEPPAVLVVRGGGQRVFVSGGDLKEFATIRSIPAATGMALRMRTVLDRLASLPSVVVAELNGDAYGGGAEVALAADFRVCADDVRIGFTQITLGIAPAWGGIERLAELVGRARALYLLTTGTVIDAAQAYAWGLVDEVVPRASFEHRCAELASMMSTSPDLALHGIKAIVNEVRPAAHGRTKQAATGMFARTWVGDAHWALLAERERARKSRKARAGGCDGRDRVVAKPDEL